MTFTKKTDTKEAPAKASEDTQKPSEKTADPVAKVAKAARPEPSAEDYRKRVEALKNGTAISLYDIKLNQGLTPKEALHAVHVALGLAK